MNIPMGLLGFIGCQLVGLDNVMVGVISCRLVGLVVTLLDPNSEFESEPVWIWCFGENCLCILVLVWCWPVIGQILENSDESDSGSDPQFFLWDCWLPMGWLHWSFRGPLACWYPMVEMYRVPTSASIANVHPRIFQNFLQNFSFSFFFAYPVSV